MKNLIYILGTACLICSQCAPGPQKTYTSVVDWDTDKNGSIGRREFVNGYSALDYFNRWSGGKSSVAYQDLFNTIFDSMDSDKEQKLSGPEFNAQIKYFFFGMFSDSFANWDDNQDGSLDRDEFNKHIASSRLASYWDTNSDKHISENEMAGGMFYLCDADGNGSVSQEELDAWRKNR